ncbi:MAG: DUF5317 domain-containing protein [Acidimicrobiia bacterium]|nr:DUF5317 domain-containing protein [Acidimicrobiia bacterium]
MRLTALAVAAGLALGLLGGGQVTRLGAIRLRWSVALWAGVGLQLLAGPFGVGGRPGTVAVIASYVALLGFAVANRGLTGMPVVLVGLALNATVIVLNGGMPVRPAAVAAVGLDPAELDGTDLGAKRHLERPRERLPALGDVVPLRPLGEVVSFGDLVLAAGVANVVFRVMRPLRTTRAPA